MARLVAVACLLLLIAVPLFTTAQETTQPAVIDNLCFEGGALAGQCVTDAQWVCGWYMAWYQRTGQNVIPPGCVSLFPAGVGTPGAPLAPVGGSLLDNACYAGGSMAGTCYTDFDWVCGWYVARFQAGIFSREQVLESCQGLVGGGAGGGSRSNDDDDNDDDDDDDDDNGGPMGTGPTATATPTLTATLAPGGPTYTPTDTPTEAPDTPTYTPTDTATEAPDTPTYTPTDTATEVPDTPTYTPTDTATEVPDTPTYTPTDTPTDTATPE